MILVRSTSARMNCQIISSDTLIVSKIVFRRNVVSADDNIRRSLSKFTIYTLMKFKFRQYSEIYNIVDYDKRLMDFSVKI